LTSSLLLVLVPRVSRVGPRDEQLDRPGARSQPINHLDVEASVRDEQGQSPGCVLASGLEPVEQLDVEKRDPLQSIAGPAVIGDDQPAARAQDAPDFGERSYFAVGREVVKDEGETRVLTAQSTVASLTGIASAFH